MQADADYDSDAFMQDDIKAAYDEAEHDEDKSRAAGTENVEEGADSFIPTIPKFISGSEETLRANERGTAYHRVMECHLIIIMLKALRMYRRISTECWKLSV